MVSVRIPLVNSNLFARVSIQDAERVMSHNWAIFSVRKSDIRYATTGSYDVTSKKTRTVYMHRFVTSAQKGEAALAYNKEAVRLFGEFATLNQVEP